MADLCCQLVGAFPGLSDCLISINSRINTDVTRIAGNIVIGATTGVVSITAYVNQKLHVGCPGRVSVQIPWLRKYDCDNDVVYFLFQGEGQSSRTEPDSIQNLATLNTEAVSYTTVNASASSGPASIYEYDIQTDGYGLTYIGEPWSFDTSDSETLSMDIGVSGYSNLYLQNFSASFQPGQVPTATYEFIYANNFSGDNSDMRFVHYY